MKSINARHSGIELLRIIAMFMILLLHANYWTFGNPSVCDVHSNTLFSFSRILLEELCIVAVDVFVIISGWFGIKPSIKGYVSISIQVLFYSLLIQILGIILTDNIYSLRSFWGVFIVGKQYWFVVSYLLLYIVSPVLNVFVNTVDKKTFGLFLFAYFFFEIIYGWVSCVENFGSGYSALSFCGLYLMARYLRLYCDKINNEKYFFLFLYLLFAILSTFIVFLSLWCGVENKAWLDKFISYISPFVVLSSFSLFLLFKNFNIKSDWINYCSGSVLSIYLIHVHPSASDIYRGFVIFLNQKMNTGLFCVSLVILLLLFMIVCIALDKIRIRITPMNKIIFICTKIKEKILCLL